LSVIAFTRIYAKIASHAIAFQAKYFKTPFTVVEKIMPDTAQYLQPTFFIDNDNPIVKDFAQNCCTPTADPRTRAVELYYAVRDTIKYDPYDLQRKRSALRASTVAQKQSGYCVAKAVLLTAAARQQNIPARLGFADVTNHLSSAQLRRIMGSDIFCYHGYSELLLEGKWVKATPAFNLSLCRRLNIKPLEFDGRSDSIFHEYDNLGQKHMEYIRDHGHFADLPFKRIFDAYEQHYPGILEHFATIQEADFDKEAEHESSQTC
jgi:transglutaminase-like putative cysteine protease